VEIIPLSAQAADFIKLLGMTVEYVPYESDTRTVSRATSAFLGERSGRSQLAGVYRVGKVYPSGPAAELGLQSGDVLFAARVRDDWGRSQWWALPNNSQQFENWIRAQAGGEVRLRLLRGNEDLQGDLPVRRLH
jgi:hypothetical protein